ncbi:ABC transporter ATP-binding protein [Insolitispirillum peregrinum]|uniref:ABC transporter ATP-binding protein n=1 Tax=Insolitispirillum peregrinum TaxID=80876 RepID=UPI0036135594
MPPLLKLEALAPLVQSPLHPEGASFEVEAGTTVAIMGPSGCGKSRLLRTIADLEPSSGTVWLNGQEKETMPAPLWRRRVVYCAAESGWWADRVGDHFQPSARLTMALEAVGLPAEAMEWSIPRLSSGERQRLALVRALTLPSEDGEGRVYLLDEPTAALDPDSTLRVERLLRSVLSPFCAVLMITHHREQAVRLANRLLCFDAGRLVAKALAP